MASGGSYILEDSTESVSFPAPITSWQEQLLGDGLNGIPALNAYRVLAWNWSSLPEDYQGSH